MFLAIFTVSLLFHTLIPSTFSQSLDPLEDLEEHAEHDLRLPPSTYDKLQQAADEEAEEIRAIKVYLCIGVQIMHRYVYVCMYYSPAIHKVVQCC
jgi:hypothetical protein